MKSKAFIFLLFVGIVAGLFGEAFVSARFPTKTVQVAPSGVTYLLNVQSAGSTASGWGDTGTINWNYTASSLQGLTPSINIVYGATNQTVSPTFASTSDCYLRFSFRYAATPTSGALYIFSLYNGATELVTVDVTTSDRLQINNFGAGGSTLVNTADNMAAGTDYYCWVHYQTGTGTSIVSVAFNTANSEPVSGNSFAGVTNDTASTTTTSVQLRNRDSNTANGAVVFNDIKARSGASIP